MKTLITLIVCAAFVAPSIEDRLENLEQRVSALEQTGVNRVALNACLDNADKRANAAIGTMQAVPDNPGTYTGPLAVWKDIREQQKQDIEECRLRYGRP